MRPQRLALFLCSWLWAPSGRTEPSSLRVALSVQRGNGTEACVAAPDLERAVEARLQRAVFDRPEAAQLRVSLALERGEKRGYRAAVVLADARGAEIGRREIETRAPHCSSLDDSLALIVALLVDSPEAQAHVASAEPPAPAASSSAAPPPVSHPLAIPPETLAPREPYRVDLAVAGAGLLGALPGVAPGVALLIAARPPHFVELRLRPAWFPSDETSAGGPGRGGRFSLLEVGFGLCPLEGELGTLRLSGCLNQSVGQVRAQGFGFVRSRATDSLVYSLGVEGSGVWRIAPPLVAVVGVGVSAPLERDTYIFRAADGTAPSLFRSSPVTATAWGGIGVEL